MKFSAFYKEFVCIYGCPVAAKSDRGSQLIGEASKAFFDLLATIHIKTTLDKRSLFFRPSGSLKVTKKNTIAEISALCERFQG